MIVLSLILSIGISFYVLIVAYQEIKSMSGEESSLKHVEMIEEEKEDHVAVSVEGLKK